MLKYGNREFRNLQEQVDKNMNDILWLINYKGALNEFGIKVVGQGPFFPDGLPNASEFTPGDVIAAEVDSELGVYICTEIDEENDWTQDIEIYKEDHTDWAYGDAWIFGDEAPYEMFILTRSNAAEPEDYFLPVGQFPIPGPQGEQGVQGPIGETPNIAMNIGSVSTLNPDQSATASISKSGTLAEPVFTINLALPKGEKGNTGSTGPQGPQGPQGPKGETGEKGEQGGLIDVVGIVSDASELPDPEELQKLDAAYLVGEESDYELYIQVGETPATAIWTNLGIMNQGTTVTVGGDPVQVWEADSKVSVYKDGAVSTIYGVSAGGSSSYHLPYGSGLVANGVVLRDASYQVTIPETPTADGHAASKKYVDTTISSKIPLQYQGDIIVAGSGGTASRLAIGSAGQYLKVNSSGNGLEYATMNGVPAYTSSDADKALVVNSLGTGLEWATVSGGGGSGSIANYKNLSNILYGGSNSTNVTKIVNSSSQTVLADAQDYGIILGGSSNTNLGNLTYSSRYAMSTQQTRFKQSILLGDYRESSSATTLYVPNSFNSIGAFKNTTSNTAPLYNSLVLTQGTVEVSSSGSSYGYLNSINLGFKTTNNIRWSIIASNASNFLDKTQSAATGSILLGGAAVSPTCVVYCTGGNPASDGTFQGLYSASANYGLFLMAPQSTFNYNSIYARDLANDLIVSDTSNYLSFGSSTSTASNYSVMGSSIVGRSLNIQAVNAGFEGSVILGYGHYMTTSGIDSSVKETTTSSGDVIRGRIIVGKCGTYSNSNYTDMFMVGAGTATNARANCFATGNDGTNDYIKVGDTKLTEADLIALLATL